MRPASERTAGGDLLRYLAGWLALLVVAVANGALRQATLVHVLPELRAHQLSTLSGALLIGAVVWLIIRAWPPASGRQALAIGSMWLLLTIGFETFMGRVLQHRPWNSVLADYDLTAGRVWVLFLVWLAVVPWLCYRRQRRQETGKP